MLKALARKILPQALWTQLRLLRVQGGIQLYRSRVVTHAYGTATLRVHLADPQAAGWYDHDWPELPELTLLKCGRLQKGARVFDIGAHQCVVALMLSEIVGTEGDVLALEPNPHNIAVGKKNKDLNGVEQLRIIQGAIAEASGTIAMNRTLNGQVDDGSHEWGTMHVPSFSIDDLSRQFGVPDVLFIDVEGFECRALAGATSTLKSNPDCFIEVHIGAGLEKFGTIPELLSFFPSERYSLFIREESQARFTEYIPSIGTPNQRFFLVALHKWLPSP